MVRKEEHGDGLAESGQCAGGRIVANQKEGIQELPYLDGASSNFARSE